jgi:hypothetical protein
MIFIFLRKEYPIPAHFTAVVNFKNAIGTVRTPYGNLYHPRIHINYPDTFISVKVQGNQQVRKCHVQIIGKLPAREITA